MTTGGCGAPLRIATTAYFVKLGVTAPIVSQIAVVGHAIEVRSTTPGTAMGTPGIPACTGTIAPTKVVPAPREPASQHWVGDGHAIEVGDSLSKVCNAALLMVRWLAATAGDIFTAENAIALSAAATRTIAPLRVGFRRPDLRLELGVAERTGLMPTPAMSRQSLNDNHQRGCVFDRL